MSPICILGIGSPFGDDQVGWQVIEMLKQQPEITPLIPQVLNLEACDRPALRLLNKFNQVKIAILIDAIKSDSILGTIHVLSGDEILNVKHHVSSHGLGISESLHIGKTLGILPKTIILYGIEIGELKFTSELSEVTKIALQNLVNILSMMPWQKFINLNSQQVIQSLSMKKMLAD